MLIEFELLNLSLPFFYPLQNYHLTGEIHFLLPHFGHFTGVGRSPFFFEKCSPQSWQMYGMGVPERGGTTEFDFGNIDYLLKNQSSSSSIAPFLCNKPTI